MLRRWLRRIVYRAAERRLAEVHLTLERIEQTNAALERALAARVAAVTQVRATPVAGGNPPLGTQATPVCEAGVSSPPRVAPHVPTLFEGRCAMFAAEYGRVVFLLETGAVALPHEPAKGV